MLDVGCGMWDVGCWARAGHSAPVGRRLTTDHSSRSLAGRVGPIPGSGLGGARLGWLLGSDSLEQPSPRKGAKNGDGKARKRRLDWERRRRLRVVAAPSNLRSPRAIGPGSPGVAGRPRAGNAAMRPAVVKRDGAIRHEPRTALETASGRLLRSKPARRRFNQYRRCSERRRLQRSQSSPANLRHRIPPRRRGGIPINRRFRAVRRRCPRRSAAKGVRAPAHRSVPSGPCDRRTRFPIRDTRHPIPDNPNPRPSTTRYAFPVAEPSVSRHLVRAMEAPSNN